MNSKHRYRFTVSYNGATFSGFQEQPHRQTVQSVIEAAFLRVLGETTRAIPSGRTDAGVHALAQVFHADFESQKAIERLAKRDFLLKLNGVLPDQIAVTDALSVTDFHARKNVKNKTYEYIILQARLPNPFLEDKIWRIGVPLDVAAMRRAAQHLLGRHDFSAFCASDSNARDKIREIKKIKFSNRSPAPFFTLPNEKSIRIAFTGPGFLKQMIRNIIGTLVEVGLGNITANSVRTILKSRDRRQAGRNAPARGLYLVHVKYE